MDECCNTRKPDCREVWRGENYSVTTGTFHHNQKAMKVIKSIVRFLADITGVSNDIYYQTIKRVGGVMYQNAYWWNGGIMHKEPKWPVWNAFFKYAEGLKEGNVSPDIMRIRDEVYKLGDKPYQTELQERIQKKP